MSIDVLSDEYFEKMSKLAQSRVSEKRFKHMQGVADTAVLLARTYGVDTREARLAGILHDWDKGLRNSELRERVVELGLTGKIDEWVVYNLPQTLHGPTAARALSIEYPEIPKSVIDAIAKHTTASIEMSDLDKVLYVADAIEPGRTFDVVDRLRELIGVVSLDELYYEVYKFWIMAIIGHDNVVHPQTLDIWNELAKDKSKKKLERYE